jgi:hypothetical protein
MRIDGKRSGWTLTMKYVSVLTPPLLVCAAFLFAVGAFLRHEMRAGRARSKRARSEDISGDGAELDTRDEPSGRSERVDDA